MARRTEWRTLFEAIETAGWRYRRCKHGIYVYPSARGVAPVTIPGTPGEFRSLRNTVAALRRAGPSRYLDGVTMLGVGRSQCATESGNAFKRTF